MKKNYYACVEYFTLREYKVLKCECNDYSYTTLIFAFPLVISKVILEEKNKFVKIKKVWLEKGGKILKEKIF